MVGITIVLAILALVLMLEGNKLDAKIATYEARQEELTRQIKEEEKRTQEINELESYMKTDEFTEKIAREKAGLVKENEIIFKEEE